MDMLSRNRKELRLFLSIYTVFVIWMVFSVYHYHEKTSQEKAATAALIMELKTNHHKLFEQHVAKENENKLLKEALKKKEIELALLKEKKRKTTSASEWKTVEMSAYTADCKEGCTGITATGLDVRDSSKDHRVIAVDPRIIPLHSVVEIEGYGYYKAMDKGGAIKGYKIDVLMQTHQQAIQFGRKYGKIRIIKKGGPL